MKKLLVLAFLLFLSCGGPKMEDAFPTNCSPFDIQADVDKGEMTVKWQKNCDRSIGGYNIYISETPLSPEFRNKQIPTEIAPYNASPYPGDTNPDDPVETFKAEGLTDGTKYFVSVRILLPNGVQSRPTKEIQVVTGPRGEIEMSIRYKSDNDGFSLKNENFVRADDLENDIYYFHQEGVDYLVSPIQLNGFLKDNKLELLAFTGRFDQVIPKLGQLDSNPRQDRVSVIEGDWVRVYTPEGHNALINVLGFTGDGDSRKVKLFYAYCGVKDELIF